MKRKRKRGSFAGYYTPAVKVVIIRRNTWRVVTKARFSKVPYHWGKSENEMKIFSMGKDQLPFWMLLNLVSQIKPSKNCEKSRRNIFDVLKMCTKT